MKNNKRKKGFTLIELLVVIAIIAILAVVVILTLNPAELLRQARDSSRVSDFATLKSAIGLYEADVSSTNLGSFGTLYANSGASGVTSTFIGTGGSSWGYATTTVVVIATSAVRTVAGGGWLLINFSAISAGSPIGSLPVDPVNNASYTYTFAPSSTLYKLAAKTESFKYSFNGPNDIESTDGGSSTGTYEQGTALSL